MWGACARVAAAAARLCAAAAGVRFATIRAGFLPARNLPLASEPLATQPAASRRETCRGYEGSIGAQERKARPSRAKSFSLASARPAFKRRESNRQIHSVVEAASDLTEAGMGCGEAGSGQAGPVEAEGEGGK